LVATSGPLPPVPEPPTPPAPVTEVRGVPPTPVTEVALVVLLVTVSDAAFWLVLELVAPPTSTALLELVLPGAVVLPISVVVEAPPALWLVPVTSEWVELAVLSLAPVALFVPPGSEAQDQAAQERHQKRA